jgi:hypothetical protein
MEIAGTDPRHEERAFTESLQRLKRHGCNLLLVGSVPGRTRAAAVRRLLGDETLRRERVVAATEESPDRITGRLEAPDARILDHASTSEVRGTTTRAVGVTRNPRVRQVKSGLDALERAIVEEIGRVERAGGLRPGELRVSVDSLRPLLGTCSVESVGEFVDRVGERVRDADGMAHHVVPASYDSTVVQSLTEYVDATVELRARRDGSEQRWHLPGADLTTPWIEL